MALDQKDFLLSEANVIRHETDDGKNTAERVGKMFVDIINGVSAMGDAIDDAINDEVEARQAADETLQGNIDTEANTRQQQDTALQTSINTETANREAADRTLQGNIDDEASAREAADNTEKADREAADTALREAIETEESARQSADDAISDVINQEITDRTAADTEIITRLEEMGLSVWPVTLDVGASASLMEYNPAGASLHFSGTIKRKGTALPDDDITSVKFKVGDGSPTNIARSANIDYTIVLSTYGEVEIVMSVEAYGITTTKRFVCTLERAMYFGFTNVPVVENVNLSSLTKQALKTEPQGDYSLTNDTDGKYLWLCVPKRMSIAKVTSSGFRVPMENAVISGEYKYYRSSAAILAGQMNITIH